MLLVLFFAIFIQILDCCCSSCCRCSKQLSIFSQIIEDPPQSMQWKITNELALQFHKKRGGAQSTLLFMISLFRCAVYVCAENCRTQTLNKKKKQRTFSVFCCYQNSICFCVDFSHALETEYAITRQPNWKCNKRDGAGEARGGRVVMHRQRQRARQASLK